MAGYMYLGNKKICPAVLIGGGDEVNVGYEVNQDGKLMKETENLVMSGFKTVGRYAFHEFFKSRSFLSADLSCIEAIDGYYACSEMFTGASLTSVDLSNLKSINGEDACFEMFYDNTALTSVDLSNLETISGVGACSGMFSRASLTSVDLSNLKSISGDGACYGMFGGNTRLASVDLSNLKSISGEDCCTSMFDGDSALTSVVFSGLETIDGNYSCTDMFGFSGIKSLSFPSLKSISGEDVFFWFLFECSDVTIHFPSNMQSAVESQSGYPNFDGENTTILFDLPPTE